MADGLYKPDAGYSILDAGDKHVKYSKVHTA